MKHYKIILFLIALVSSGQIFAQASESKILSKLSFSFNYKESILMSKPDFKTQSRELFAGYKFFNSFVIGLSTGVYNEFNVSANEFNYFNHYGIGIKYQYLFEKKLLNKTFVMEPFLIINNALSSMNNDSFIFYDVGMNFIYARAPYFFFGTGVMQNFYSEKINTTINWYYIFGLRF